MKRLSSLLLVLVLTVLQGPAPAVAQEAPRYVLAIHGGAGTITRDAMTPELEEAYHDALREALEAGHRILSAGGSSLDAVVATIQVMEASPLFNAGVGAVFTSEGTVEHDASIMDGRTRDAGAVSGLKHIESPIALARSVMEQSPHVMLSGAGAERFAEEQGFQKVPNEHFHTDRRRRQLERAQEAERGTGPTGDAALTPDDREADAHRFGTVGAVALDRDGNLAAGTSTGGMTNKRFGRVGDSPIIGAGTYADNETAAISSTGHGEFFIRGVVAYDIAAMMRYAGLDLTAAANAVVMGRLGDLGGTGGVIALDRHGNVAAPFNTPGMYRGWIDAEGNVEIFIYRH
ncbi:MAG: isoaspartyl peptidase/L-asparaginase [Rhodothermales bacterium]|nr:isoaspartyl peptidase/L-asparaginase [Rhodothermales bacterium]